MTSSGGAQYSEPDGHVDWRARILEALVPGRLTAHYQPIIDVRRGTVVGYEALSRFDALPSSAPGGSPEAWFDAARELGLSASLEAAALCAALSRREQLPGNTFLAVNLGPEVIATPEVREVLAQQRTLAGLVVELTEQTKVESYAGLEPALDQLRARGAMIAIDDAGSGYAGLQHLLSIRPSFIKLDRALVCGVDTDEAKRALVEMMGTLAGRLDAWLLAEGVETAAELDTLARMGVPLVQGYHLARPSPTWGGIDLHTSLRLVTLGREQYSGTLRPMVEWTPTCTDPDQAARCLELDGVTIVVVLDHEGCPSMTMDGAGIFTAMRDGLRVNVDTPVVAAARRAITRPREARFDPLVCIDNAGRYVGVVPMERLVERLSQEATPRTVVGG